MARTIPASPDTPGTPTLAQLRAVGGSLPSPTWVVAADGTLSYANAALCRFVGRADAEIVGTSFAELLHPEDREAALDRLQAVLAEPDHFEAEWRVRHVGGEYRWLAVSVEPWLEEGQLAGHILAAVDVHARRQEVQHLRDFDAAMQAVLRAGRMGTWEVDLAVERLSVSRTIRTHEAEFYDRPGGVEEALLAKVHPQDHDRVRQAVAHTLATLTPLEIEIRARSHTGEERYLALRGLPFVDDAGRPRRLVGVVADITERRQAMEERARLVLKEQETRAREARAAEVTGIIQHMPCGVLVFDADGTLLLVNERAMQMLSPEPVPAQPTPLDAAPPAPELLDARILGHCRALVEQALRGSSVGDQELPPAADQDGARVLIGSAAPLNSPDGQVRGAVAVITDVTNERRLLHEVKDREHRLQDALRQHLLAQEEERRRVAYDLHDGLAQTAAATHLSLQSYAADHRPRSPETRQQLEKSLDLARRVVREARQVIAGLRPTALDDFGLERALRLHVQEAAVEGLTVEYHADLAGERLPGPVETVLYRIAQEALTNVRKHAHTSSAMLSVRRLDGLVELAVTDKGDGFEASAVTIADGPGRNVGLVSMRERAALVGGECTVESCPGQGTRISVRIPVRPADED